MTWPAVLALVALAVAAAVLAWRVPAVRSSVVMLGIGAAAALVIAARRRPPPAPSSLLVPASEPVRRTAADILADRAQRDAERVRAAVEGPSPEADVAALTDARRHR